MSHVILVAFHIQADTRQEAHKILVGELLGLDFPELEDRWVAEDDRTDESDNDSAVFVRMGRQHDAGKLLAEGGWAHSPVKRTITNPHELQKY